MEVVVQAAPSPLEDALADSITALVNAAYEDGERELWQPGHQRTSAAEIRTLAERRQLLLATGGDRLLGSIHVQVHGSEGSLGMLSVLPSERRAGVGRALIAAAEAHCRAAGCTTMQLELLTPQGWTHPVKHFLDQWYRRIGYVPQGTKSFEGDFAPLLSGPCDFTRYVKPLTP
eukprot:EG_transcript_23314